MASAVPESGVGGVAARVVAGPKAGTARPKSGEFQEALASASRAKKGTVKGKTRNKAGHEEAAEGAGESTKKAKSTGKPAEAKAGEKTESKPKDEGTAEVKKKAEADTKEPAGADGEGALLTAVAGEVVTGTPEDPAEAADGTEEPAQPSRAVRGVEAMPEKGQGIFKGVAVEAERPANGGEAKGDGDESVGVQKVVPEMGEDAQKAAAMELPEESKAVTRKTPADQSANPLLAASDVGQKLGQVEKSTFAAPLDRPEAIFAADNHPQILETVRVKLQPDGGTMTIRLDPPELGALQIRVEMRDGLATALFQTSNEQATRLLSHSLNELKQGLEAQGVAVEKLQVHQVPREMQTASDDQQRNGDQSQNRQGQEEQQRRELLRRMWQRLAMGRDALDVTG